MQHIATLPSSALILITAPAQDGLPAVSRVVPAGEVAGFCGEVLDGYDPTSVGQEHVSPATVAAMRGWLAELQWADMEADDFVSVPDRKIIAAVERHYCGGVAAFIAAG